MIDMINLNLLIQMEKKMEEEQAIDLMIDVKREIDAEPDLGLTFEDYVDTFEQVQKDFLLKIRALIDDEEDD